MRYYQPLEIRGKLFPVECCFVWACLFLQWASAQEFEPPVLVLAEGQPVRVASPGYACPTIADVDQDGLDDLVVGQFKDGNLIYFRNVAPAGQPPKLAAGRLMMADGQAISIPGIRCCTSSTPQWVDWNQDGHLDILSGSYAAPGSAIGQVVLLLGQPNRQFARPVALTGSLGRPLQNREFTGAGDETQSVVDCLCTHQHAVDIDGDGDLDLVVGSSSGRFFLYINEGEPSRPSLRQPSRMVASPLKAGRSAPHLVDWDGDGLMDLLAGSADGGVYLSLNQGTKTEPDWKEFQTLIPATENRALNDLSNLVRGDSSRIWVYDWNQDGLLDLLVGDRVRATVRDNNGRLSTIETGHVWLFIQKPPDS